MNIVFENGVWVLYDDDGSVVDTFDTQEEAQAAMDSLAEATTSSVVDAPPVKPAVCQECGQPMALHTSEDQCPMKEAQCQEASTHDVVTVCRACKGESRCRCSTPKTRTEFVDRCAACQEAAPCQNCGQPPSAHDSAGLCPPKSQAPTSESLDANPFLVDGVPLSRAQVYRLNNLVVGRSRPPGPPMTLSEALATWRRQNVVVTESGKRRWKVHSASPTYRPPPGPVAPVQEAHPTEGPSKSAPLPFREASTLRSILEADPTGRTWEVTLIREGWSANRRYYPRTVLEAALPLFEGVSINEYGWDPAGANKIGHVPLSARYGAPGGELTRNKVGWVDQVHGVVSEGRYEVVGTFHCVRPDLAISLLEAWRAGKRDYLGFSIDGMGDGNEGLAEGKTGYVVSALKHIDEVTLVSNPAAGGKITRLVAAADPNEKEQTLVNVTEQLRSFARARLQAAKRDDSIVAALSDKALCESVIGHAKAFQAKDPAAAKATASRALRAEIKAYCRENKLQEMDADDLLPWQIVSGLLDGGNVDQAKAVIAMIVDAIGKAAASADVPSTDDMPVDVAPAMTGVAEAVRIANESATTLQKLVESQQVQLKMMELRPRLTQILTESKLPAAFADDIRSRFVDRVWEEKELLEAIEVERKKWVAVAPTLQEGVTGQNRLNVTADAADKLQAMSDLLIGYVPLDEAHDSEGKDKLHRELMKGPRIRGFKTLYQEATGDMEIRRFGQNHLREATTASIATILNNTLGRRVNQLYAMSPALWQRVVDINPNVDNFKAQTAIEWGGFGQIPVVAESDSGTGYTSLGFPREDKSSYQVQTRGGTVTWTRAMMKNDDLRAMQDLPKKLSEAAYYTLMLDVFRCLTGQKQGNGINGDKMYDGNPIYDPTHRNYTTSALSYASMIAARTAFDNQFIYGNSTTVTDTSANNTTDPVTIAVGSTVGFQPGDYAVLDSETVLVTAVGDSTHLTIKRGQLGTTNAAHATNTIVYQVSRPIMPARMTLVVPADKRGVAEDLLGSEKIPGTINNDVSSLYNMAQREKMLDFISIPTMYMGSPYNWFLVQDPTAVPGLEIAFMDNQQTPEVLLADMPQVDPTFSGDDFRYKLRYEWGLVCKGYRALYGGIATA